MHHPGTRLAASNAGHVEEGDDAAGIAALVAVGHLSHLRVVGIHSLPNQPESKQPGVEVDVRLDIGSDRRDVMETVNLHGATAELASARSRIRPFKPPWCRSPPGASMRPTSASPPACTGSNPAARISRSTAVVAVSSSEA